MTKPENSPQVECTYCGQPLGSEAPVFAGGEPMHRCCEAKFAEEWAALDAFDADEYERHHDLMNRLYHQQVGLPQFRSPRSLPG